MDFVTKKISGRKFLKFETKIFDIVCAQKLISKTKNKTCALDCTNIECFKDTKTLEIIIRNNIALCCASTQLIQQVSLMCSKNFPKIFMSTDDFIADKRMLVKRRFRLI